MTTITQTAVHESGEIAGSRDQSSIYRITLTHLCLLCRVFTGCDGGKWVLASRLCDLEMGTFAYGHDFTGL